jgi:periplasmic protein TonB
MTTLETRGRNFPVINGLAAVIITFMLLILCTQLAKITPPTRTVEYEPHFIDYVPPPEPPEMVTEENIIEPKPLTQKNITPPDRIPYETVMPNLNNGTKFGTIPIPVVKPRELITAPPKHNEIFTVGQVDRNPRVLRPFIPTYPADAQRKGIEGKVVLRFVVDENGQVQDPEIVKAEPAGVFEQAALEAIVKYRFDPAVVNKKKVKCYAILPIGFRLN